MSTAFLDELRRATEFEQVGALLLDAVLDSVGAAAARSGFERATVPRATVHLRPGGGYRGFLVRERDRWTPAETPAVVSSLTAWRAVQQTRAPVALDVTLGRLSDLEDRELDGGAVDRPSIATGTTLQLLAERGITHMLVVPLRGLAGRLDGMVTVEAHAPEAIGTVFSWPAVVGEIQRLADLAAPYLAGLPMAPTPVESAGELLPVVGASTGPLVRLLRVFAKQEETILISGPTGAGKSRMARWVHACSNRTEGRFESVDLQAIPEELQLGELFGWRRGAFTGAVRDQVGMVERAHRGTLFIDEIDKLSLRAQAGLLRLLEERRFQVVGDAVDRVADTRFVVGTNADLPALVRERRFREDLYYRIHVLPVRLPALNERADEIPAWATWMVARRHREAGSGGSARITAEAGILLGAFGWPGNLRQLDNVVRRAYVAALADGAPGPGGVTLDRRHVEWALAAEQGGGAAAPVASLVAAAQRLVARIDAAGPVDLDVTGGFLGFVLVAAEAHTGSREAALRLLGMDAVVRNRNAHRVYRRELTRAAALCRALGEAPPKAWEDESAERRAGED